MEILHCSSRSHTPTLTPIISARASDPITRLSADFFTASSRADSSASCQSSAIVERAATMLARITRAFSAFPESPFPCSSRLLYAARISKGSHLSNSRVRLPLPSSNCQRTSALRKLETSCLISSRDSMLAVTSPIAEETVSATAALSRTSLASCRALLSCSSTSSCCLRLDRFSTAMATSAAKRAAGIPPIVPARSVTHISLSSPQHMSPTLLEVPA